MTKTVLIEGLIEVLKGIANKISNNPTNSHLISNVTSETNSVLLTGAAKNTALKQLFIDFEPYQRDTPSTEEPATIFAPEFFDVFVSENEMVEGEEPEGELNAYAINLGRVVYGGIIDIKNKRVRVTWEYIESYDGETLPAEWLSTMDVYAEGTTPTTGAGVAYKIAEPYYINIDDNTIKTITSANNCYVTGDTYYTKAIEVDYVRDEALAIENLEQGGGGVTRDLIGDFDISTTQSGNLTTTKDMSQYDILEIEWIEKGNRWMGGYWANEHIMFARYKTSDPKDTSDTSGLFYSSSTATSMAYTGDIGMAVRFVDPTTLANMNFGNAFISKIWGIKY